MPATQLQTVLDNLRRVAMRQDRTGATDAELVEYFVETREEAAFEALVRRHGPMVLGVCRRVLRNESDAEDAFQATFLVLVRKAASISPRSMVGNWLYGVAHSTALKAKAMNMRRRVKELQTARLPRSETSQEEWQRLQAVLDQELSRLPARYRVPIVLCELEGKKIKDAARQLGWPQGTLASRLARGRAMLGKRLARHDLTMPAGTLTTALVCNAASAALPKALLTSTLQAASVFAVGAASGSAAISTSVAALAEGMVKTMFMKKLTCVLGVLVLAGFALSGVSVVCKEGLAGQSEKSPAAAKRPEQAQQAVKPIVDTSELNAIFEAKKWSVRDVDEKTRMLVLVEDNEVRWDHGDKWKRIIFELDVSGRLKITDLRVDDSAEILVNGKPGKINELKRTVEAAIRFNSGRFSISRIEAFTQAPFPELPRFTIESIDVANQTINMSVIGGKEKLDKIPVSKDAKIMLNLGHDGTENGNHLGYENAKLQDLQPGMANVTLSGNDGRLMVSMIIQVKTRKGEKKK